MTKRTLHNYICALFCCVILTTVQACAGLNSGMIRVGLSRYNRSATRLCISASSSCAISRLDDGSLLAPGAGSFIIESGASEMTIKPEKGNQVGVKSAIIIKPETPKGILTLSASGIAERKYRGSIEVTVSDGALKVVNVVDVEDYLFGVLPAEMRDSNPTEALRAQAITARTYALGCHSRHIAQGFDLCDSTHCQTYDGVIAENPKCRQAVIDTRGMALTYNGQVAEVMYSADCGGATVNYSEIRPGANYPYLCGAIDPVDIPRITWEQEFAVQDLACKLATAGIKEAADLQSVTVTRTGLSGRPLGIEIAGKSGKVIVTPDKIRMALGLKSTMFVIESGGDGKIVIKGKGWGHGIGLCQTGAKWLASAPYNYTCAQILSHYFPGTDITGGKVVASFTKSDKTAPADVLVKPSPAVRETFNVRLQAPDRL
ncbi:MAG: SpoIID/LytB domain-containing protein [Armatimonadota bacterium]|nr:SpoIID/LytB domain-containing protein [bacterium]